MGGTIAVTRNIQGSVLLELGTDSVVTDLFFRDYWFARMHERRGIEAANLPRLTAIIGCHGVFDHWHPRSMADYLWKEETPVFCATEAMVRSAARAGFARARVLGWGERTRVGGLTIEAVEAQYATCFKVNNYVLESSAGRVFFGSEARDISPLLRYRAANAPVQLCVLPIDGSTVFGQRLVMLPHEAIDATRILGARHLVPIHYSVKALPPLLSTPAGLADLAIAAERAPDIEVHVLGTGERCIVAGDDLPAPLDHSE